MSGSKEQSETQQTQKSESTKPRERFVYQDDDVIDKPFNWGQLRRLGGYLKPYKRQLIPVILVTMLLGTFSKLAIPYLISLAIDKAIYNGDGNLLLIYASTMLALYIVQWFVNRFRIRYINIIGQNVLFDLRHALFSHIQQLSFRFFDKRPAGSILVRITNDVNSLQDLFTNGVINLLIDCVQLVGIIIILLSLSPKLGLAIIVTVPLMFVVSTALRKR
ncbi:MAG: multidrug transporter ATP-binding protein, partial [Paenibacillus sp.]|nr:multidrug transporter ATP-binding protein [Paenibacillus sp.]